MVVAIGVYVGHPVADVAVVTGGDPAVLSVVSSVRALDLPTIIELARERCGRPHDRLAVSYPAPWDSLRVDRLLREVRAMNVVVDRYVTSAEAAVRWWRHRHAQAVMDGIVVVEEAIGGSRSSTVVRVEGFRVETMATPADEHAGSIVIAVGEHDVALGTALSATL